LCFATRKEAIDFLLTPPDARKPAVASAQVGATSAAPGAPAPAPAAPPPSAAAATPFAKPAAPADTAVVGAPPSAASFDEITALRARVAELESEVKALQEQVVLTTIARRPPANEQVYDEKIAFLEAKVEKLVNDAAAAPTGKKA
jgi:hypothetical protein